MTQPVMEALSMQPEACRVLLRALKEFGEARADQLAQKLGLHVSGVRQHLSSLEAEGVVEHRVIRSQRGRPKFVYGLSHFGRELFPRAYSAFANQMLEFVEEEDAELQGRLFGTFARKRAERVAPRLAGKSLAARVRELGNILDEDGYEASVQKVTGGYRIIERNCAVFDVAQRFHQVCMSELEFLRRVLPDAEVNRVRHLIGGDTFCAYEIRPRARAVLP